MCEAIGEGGVHHDQVVALPRAEREEVIPDESVVLPAQDGGEFGVKLDDVGIEGVSFQPVAEMRHV